MQRLYENAPIYLISFRNPFSKNGAGTALERLAGLSQILRGFFGAPSPTSLIDSLPEPPSGSFEDRIQNPLPPSVAMRTLCLLRNWNARLVS